MEVLKKMLESRGVSTAAPESIEGGMTKFERVVVHETSKTRPTEKDIDAMLEATRAHGGDVTIILVPEPPSSTVFDVLRKRASDKVQLFHPGNLLFDITTHRKVPRHRILTPEEREAFMKKYHIKDPAAQMPMLDSQDIMARWIGAVPGDIVEILRRSETAGTTPYYRYCVADVTL